MTELNSESGLAQKEIARFNSALSAPRPIRHLNQKELARRWSMSPKTLERWRWLGEGPPYLKIGGKVLYQLADVEAYEVEAKRTHKNDRLFKEAAALHLKTSLVASTYRRGGQS